MGKLKDSIVSMLQDTQVDEDLSRRGMMKAGTAFAGSLAGKAIYDVAVRQNRDAKAATAKKDEDQSKPRPPIGGDPERKSPRPPIAEGTTKNKAGAKIAQQGATMTNESYKHRQKVYYKGHEALYEGVKNGMLVVKVPGKGSITVKASDVSKTKPQLNESVFIAPISFTASNAKSFDLDPTDVGLDEIVAVREEDDGYDGEKKDTHYKHAHGMPDPSDTVATAQDDSSPDIKIDPLTTEPGADENAHIDIAMQTLPNDAPTIPDPQADDSGNSRPIAMSTDMDAGQGDDGSANDDKFTNTDSPGESKTKEEPKAEEPKKEPATDSETGSDEKKGKISERNLANKQAKDNLRDVGLAEPRNSGNASNDPTLDPRKPMRNRRFQEALKAHCSKKGRALKEDGENGSITLTMDAAMVVLGTLAEKQADIDLVAKIVEAMDTCCGGGKTLTVEDLHQVAATVRGAAGGSDEPAADGSDPVAPEGDIGAPEAGEDDGASSAVAVPDSDGEAAPDTAGAHAGKDTLMASDDEEEFPATESLYYGIDDIEEAINASLPSDEEQIMRLKRISGQKDWWKK